LAYSIAVLTGLNIFSLIVASAVIGGLAIQKEHIV